MTSTASDKASAAAASSSLLSFPCLSTRVGGIDFCTCVYNASGPRTASTAALAKIAASAGAGGVLTKSATVEAQTGNVQPRTWHGPMASLNSEGLPNPGIDYYLNDDNRREAMGIRTTATTTEQQQQQQQSTATKTSSSSSSKPYMVSISGKTLEDNLEMFRRIVQVCKNDHENRSCAGALPPPKIAAVELNLACPNVIGKPIIGYDWDQFRTVLDTIHREIYNNATTTTTTATDTANQEQQTCCLPVLGLKLPPYLDLPHIDLAAEIINAHADMIGYVASVNTLGNALAVTTSTQAPTIRPKGGLGGLSGPALKYTALANVRLLRQRLHTSIDVVGVGGIVTGEDVFQMLLCGAAAVQVGTTHWKEGPGCFDRICRELQELLQTKGYKHVSEICGALQEEWKRPTEPSTAEKSTTAFIMGRANSQRSLDSQALGGTSKNVATTEGGFYFYVSVVLMVVIAILLADKFGVLGVEE